ncbi:MAG: phosphotransferase family protein [Pseudomonadota bacterium]
MRDLARPERQAAVATWLARAAEAKDARIEEARPLIGGAIQENWYLRVVLEGGPRAGEMVLVLRTDAPSGVAVSHSRSREFRLLQVAWRAGVTVPEPLWLCEDHQVLGQAFYLMVYRAGIARGNKLVRDGAPGGDKEALVERLGQELAKIHAIVPPRPELDFLALPEGPAALRDIALYRRHLDALGQARPALEWALRWCEVMAPPQDETVLLHQDFRTGNFLVDDTGLTAILDWEFCDWGDPMSDLGWFCARCWRFGRDDREAGGLGSRAAFYRGYEAVSGRRIAPDVVAYWEVMAHLRWAVIALQQAERHLSGEQASLELALTGRVIAELEFELLKMTAPANWRMS